MIQEEINKAAEAYADKRYPGQSYPHIRVVDDFIAGAKWMAEQGISYIDKIYPYSSTSKEYCVSGDMELPIITEAIKNGVFDVGDEVIVQITKK